MRNEIGKKWSEKDLVYTHTTTTIATTTAKPQKKCDDDDDFHFEKYAPALNEATFGLYLW